MIRPPPRSTLFPPHDALPISQSRNSSAASCMARPARTARCAWDSPSPWGDSHAQRRSEEHMSELQSLAYLVCRLLLEKKKPSNYIIYIRYEILCPATIILSLA